MYKIRFINNGFDFDEKFKFVSKEYGKLETARSIAIAYAGDLYREVNVAYENALIVTDDIGAEIRCGDLSMRWEVYDMESYEYNSYAFQGISDSKEAGWFDDNGDTASLTVRTPVGKIIAKVSGDQSYPGLYIDFQQHGSAEYEQIALIDYTPDENGGSVKMRVWGNPNEDETFEPDGESYTFCHTISLNAQSGQLDGQQCMLGDSDKTDAVIEKVKIALDMRGKEVISVDYNEETGMIDINECHRNWSDCVFGDIASVDDIDKNRLIRELGKLGVGSCL